ncbi:hypothetical protein K469DRAFT_718459 [Zopfia rhizophila CBS 207.26]|uniref:Uncharacterized protein n=1 Tax=Zopfia rhizophila CBS 207.26 TaxID=1314779 RepID=A0A6A6DJC3_9PEZI|nr:hypothetical protein K469DRAFT_718459 [Zopfia rhizophila CBS 207.26]
MPSSIPSALGVTVPTSNALKSGLVCNYGIPRAVGYVLKYRVWCCREAVNAAAFVKMLEPSGRLDSLVSSG